ncbi:hypothetical protein R545_25595 [Salmonella enterica subsp. diarizonae serovar Rough:r:z]|uniref:Uncharacterized protein n=3 Tax=Salmonella enterica TaxID=28901 RepID=A0A7Z1PLH2_SALET|nr:hypothetical protein [Salmonella enterica]EBY9434071.1 hypothetical protein [Salmonella enterica subsp. enterica serovar Cerro]ESG55790.1 hypothetical protein SEEM1594_27822 [Salmonella enterica subsp. enterica serovar Muenchen str. baa1594]OSG79760.1 hypothetical protein R545_25595 [Salmonella enterica subsp. diarizonae serovar Rough:r:z]PTU38389.1 hypothetical protein DAY03_27910 [Salmonella enterica subsp. enterica]
MKVLSSLCYTVVVTYPDSPIMSQRRKVHSNSLAGQLDILISRLAQKSGNKSCSRRQIYGFRVYILDISEEMKLFCKKNRISIGYARFMETEFRGDKDLLIVFAKRFFSAMQENEVSICYLYDTEICD